MNLTTLLLALFSLLVSPSFVFANHESNTFTAPLAGDLVTAGFPFQVRWINLDGGIVNLILVRGTPNSLRTIGALAAGIPNTGVFNWNVPYNLETGTDYAIEIQYGAEKNFTPMFTVVSPGPGTLTTSTRPKGPVTPPTVLVEKTTQTGAVLTESYPIYPASPQPAYPVSAQAAQTSLQTIIATSATTLVFPTPAEEDLPPEKPKAVPEVTPPSFSGGKIITLDPTPKPQYSSTTVTYPWTISTSLNGSMPAYTFNRTRTTSTWITPTAGSISNNISAGIPICLALLLAGLIITL
ncbi:hypothetical protein TWF481_011422 [Arthrobotrys musiformis]|uniref:Yeast cell wall synthesis Kre9/Knh1-like N-terminal domain-containing protein n=1 Tax=Arthrobotrys musiformis TaxID=47236 RepID=A0AAV9W047_9PEZI